MIHNLIYSLSNIITFIEIGFLLQPTFTRIVYCISYDSQSLLTMHRFSINFDTMDLIWFGLGLLLVYEASVVGWWFWESEDESFVSDFNFATLVSNDDTSYSGNVFYYHILDIYYHIPPRRNF